MLQNPEITNQFAAVPSFHVGWNLLVAFAIFRASRNWSLRLVAIVFPMLMVTAVLLTANHWVLDIVAGIAVALIGIGAAALFERFLAPRIAPEITPAPAEDIVDVAVDVAEPQTTEVRTSATEVTDRADCDVNV